MIFLFPTELEAAKLKALRPDLDIRICGIGAVETATEVARILRAERKPLLISMAGGLTVSQIEEYAENKILRELVTRRNCYHRITGTT